MLDCGNIFHNFRPRGNFLPNSMLGRRPFINPSYSARYDRFEFRNGTARNKAKKMPPKLVVLGAPKVRLKFLTIWIGG